jgi:hypothetical protein
MTVVKQARNKACIGIAGERPSPGPEVISALRSSVETGACAICPTVNRSILRPEVAACSLAVA